ncbi:hypothetical protein [Edaphobacter bradus]|uniref:hypothetical protein n=1 Tax=Edaphobacter bradus TaxID=2259016 RepID=UPI0021DF6B92|nr:hypothetical protein [Edaphobacter bradus]
MNFSLVRIASLLLASLAAPLVHAQTKAAIPLSAPEPTSPPASTFHDSRYGVTFQSPVGWTLTRRDAEVSTFANDAHTAASNTRMRGVATISFNPHPTSTFSGALFYFSVTPRSNDHDCRLQASGQTPRTVTTQQIGSLTFNHGYDEHGKICVEARDEIYTTLRNNTCYRFDLVINTFCGGEVSGVREISKAELDAVRQRLESILSTVHFDTK